MQALLPAASGDAPGEKEQQSQRHSGVRAALLAPGGTGSAGGGAELFPERGLQSAGEAKSPRKAQTPGSIEPQITQTPPSDPSD
jgi:hypothetical protein